RDHLKGIASRIESGAWIMGGPSLEYPPIDGQEKAINGSCIVANAPSREEVMEEIKKDIYATSGVWNLEKIAILPETLLASNKNRGKPAGQLPMPLAIEKVSDIIQCGRIELAKVGCGWLRRVPSRHKPKVARSQFRNINIAVGSFGWPELSMTVRNQSCIEQRPWDMDSWFRTDRQGL
ncbi:hypothetical protein FOC4_g10000196, partial [Fusarium odoratissimum]